MSWTAFSGRGIRLGDLVDDEAAVAENQSQNASTLVVIDDETKESSTEALSTRAPLPEIDLDHEASIRQRMTDLTEAMHELSISICSNSMELAKAATDLRARSIPKLLQEVDELNLHVASTCSQSEAELKFVYYFSRFYSSKEP